MALKISFPKKGIDVVDLHIDSNERRDRDRVGPYLALAITMLHGYGVNDASVRGSEANHFYTATKIQIANRRNHGNSGARRLLACASGKSLTLEQESLIAYAKRNRTHGYVYEIGPPKLNGRIEDERAFLGLLALLYAGEELDARDYRRYVLFNNPTTTLGEMRRPDSTLCVSTVGAPGFVDQLRYVGFDNQKREYHSYEQIMVGKASLVLPQIRSYLGAPILDSVGTFPEIPIPKG